MVDGFRAAFMDFDYYLIISAHAPVLPTIIVERVINVFIGRVRIICKYYALIYYIYMVEH